MHNRSFLSTVCTGMLVFGGYISSVAAVEAVNNEPAPVIYQVKSRNSGGAMRLGGSVVPEQIVNLTAQMPGDVSSVAGAEGDFFKKGDVLVTLDKKALLAKREQAVSQLASADAGYRNAMAQYKQELVNPNSQGNTMMGGAPGMFSMFSDPARSMMGQNPGMERGTNIYGRQIQIETARNSVTQAGAAIRELDESLQNTISYAPFDGVILKKMVEKGDIVQPGMPLISFADITRLQIRVEVPTRLLGLISVGSRVQAQLDGASDPVPVMVDRIFPMADTGGHTTTVKFDLPTGAKAHSGMYAEVVLPDPAGNIDAMPVVPESAIVWRGSLPAVFQVQPDGSVRLRLIRVDEMPSGGMVGVISGIDAGDRVLVNPAPNTRGTR